MQYNNPFKLENYGTGHPSTSPEAREFEFILAELTSD